MLAITGGTPVRNKAFPTWPIRDQSDEEAVAQAIRSGVWGIGGKCKPEFEAKFAELQTAKHCVVACNGTVTLQMALTALGVGPGDEVIIPAYTFIATSAAVFHTGAIPVIVDIDPDTYCIDPKAVEAAITERTACIVPVHVAGNPSDMDAICALADQYGLAVLEDAAQAHGAQWNGRGVGSIGDMGSFSFQSSKNLASGEGGALVTNNDFLVNLARAYADCGRYNGADGPRAFLGWDYRMTEMQAALLLSQLKRFEAQAAQRDANGQYLAEKLQSITGIKPAKRDSRVTRHAYHLFMFSVDESVWGVSTNVFMDALRAEGIPCSAGYVPLYRASGFVAGGQSCPSAWAGIGQQLTSQDYNRMYLPVSEAVCRNTVWLTQRMLLGSQADMDDIVTAIEKLWQERAALQKVRSSASGHGYAGL
jgi:dTDP-4-amino-4,6-dideoxygalactose transaminase